MIPDLDIYCSATGAAGSLVLRRMDRRGRAKKHSTKSGSDAPLRRGFLVPASGLPVPGSAMVNPMASPFCDDRAVAGRATGVARRRVSTYLVEFMRRKRPLNLYQPASDTGLLKILALVAGVILIVISGAFDCRFQFIHVGFC